MTWIVTITQGVGCVWESQLPSLQKVTAGSTLVVQIMDNYLFSDFD